MLISIYFAVSARCALHTQSLFTLCSKWESERSSQNGIGNWASGNCQKICGFCNNAAVTGVDHTVILDLGVCACACACLCLSVCLSVCLTAWHFPAHFFGGGGGGGRGWGGGGGGGGGEVHPNYQCPAVALLIKHLSIYTYIFFHIHTWRHNSRCMPLPDRKWPITSFRRRLYELPVAWLGWVSARATWWPCLCRTVWSFRSCFWRWLPWELWPVLSIVLTLQVCPRQTALSWDVANLLWMT